MTAVRRGEKREQLIRRAGMDIYSYNTSVVRGTDGVLRIAVGGYMNPLWGDCVAVGFMREGTDHWLYTHLSPARARILADHLLRVAAMKERDGIDRIDDAGAEARRRVA